MKQGFMLIELIVATMVASMVAAILLAALTQSNRFQTAIDSMVDSSVRIGVISHQFEKDLMGVFIPVQAEQKDSKKKEAVGGADKKSDDKKTDEKKSTEPKNDVQKIIEKKEPKPIEKIFYSTHKDGKLDTLTFITNNPLVVYVGKDVGVVKPKAVRVQYTLKLEADKKDSYALFRQEGIELDLEQYKNVTAHEIIGGIKSCTVTFTARIEKKDEKNKDAKEKPKVSYEYKVLNDWVSERKKEEGKDQQEFPRVPYSVEMKLVLWDKQYKKEKEYTIICSIPVVDFTQPKKEDNKKQQKSAKDAAAPQSPPAANDEQNRQSVQQIGLHSAPKDILKNQHSAHQTVAFNGLESLTQKLDGLTKIFGRR